MTAGRLVERTGLPLGQLARAVLLPSFPGSVAPDWLLAELDRGLGGVTLFAINGNVADLESLAGLTAQLRANADPIITIDEEGGDVTRLAHATGSPYPGNAALGAVDDVGLTEEVYASLGAELAGVGVNLNFAPSIDVNSVADNPIIGTRSFGADPELVARHAVAAVTGMQRAGVAACAKHFPGHGATVQDSHLEMPVVDADLDLLTRRELVPFRAAIAAGVQSIMIGHLDVPALTRGVAATLSKPAITGLLRESLGFEGVIVTDALDMAGASGALGIPEASVRSLIAGADLLCLGPHEHAASVHAVTAAIEAAVRDGRLSLERLEDAASRVRALSASLRGQGGGVPDPAIGLAAARRAVSVLGELPSALAGALVVQLDSPGNIAVGPVPWGLSEWVAPESYRCIDAADSAPAEVLTAAAGRPLVLVVRDAHRGNRRREFVTALLAERPDAVLVEMGLPVWRPKGTVQVASYGATRATAQAVAERLGLGRVR